MKELILIAIGSALVNNVVLSQFLGICPFLGVSKRTDTAAGMGGAVIFVITISSLLTSIIYNYLLVGLHIEYLKTIVFILVIAALVQFVEMFLKRAVRHCISLSEYISAHHNQLCGARCCTYKCTEGLRYSSVSCERLCNRCRFYNLNRYSRRCEGAH